MKLTRAAILVSRGTKVLQAAPAAYRYRSAKKAVEGQMVTQTSFMLSPDYGRSLGRGAVVVFALLVLTGLFSDDGGLTGQITLMAVLGYLGGVAVMAARRPRSPSAFDLWLVRWGFVPLWLAVQVGVRCAWSWMGRL